MRAFADQWQKMMNGEVELQAGSEDDDDTEPESRTNRV